MTSSLHRRSLRAALAACTALLAGACMPGGAGTGPAPQEPEATLAPAEWNAQSPAGEIATWAWQGCRRAPRGRDACIERALVSLIDQAGIGKSMEVLDTLATRDDGVRSNAHPLAHGLGIAAYRSPETLAATFAACPVSQMSGCPHGVIQGYFLDLSRQGRSIGTAEMDGLCNPHKDKPFMYFQCAHGVGHGLMAVHENHLPMSLEACDLATDDFVRLSCYGGAFMENIVNATHPHHSAGGHATVQGDGHGDGHADHGQAQAGAGHDAHGGHGAAGARQAMDHGEWKALDRNDWLYPCNAVAEKYQDSCYTMQTSAVMFFNYGDVGSTSAVCDRAPSRFAATCFMSLGRDITAFAAQQHQRTIDMCMRAGVNAGGGRGRQWCYVGAVQTLMNQSADSEPGMRFCRLLPGADDKRECYRVVGEMVATLVPGTDQRSDRCRLAENEFVATCRRGAGIEPTSNGSDE
ncbi:MAG TPA: hypothetical protein VF142_22075 [Longimicrobium sp.]